MATRLRISAIDIAPGRRARSAQAKDHVRQALIDAGRELLLARSTQPLSLRGIARHAGYTSGVIYRYFADRDALFLAIRDSEMENFFEGLEADFPQDNAPEDRLFAIADRAFAFTRYQIDAFGTNSLFLFWRDSSGTPMAEKSVHDDAPSAARIHAFFENAVEPILSDNAGLPVAVGALMAAIAGPALLPDSSGHRGLPQGRAIMRETIAALISRWRGNT